MKILKFLIIFLTLQALLVSCINKKEAGRSSGYNHSSEDNGPEGNPDNNRPPVVPVVVEVGLNEYCGSPRLYEGNTITLNGVAKYQARIITGDGLGGPTEKISIRFMEVVVLDPNENIVQCAETNENGEFSLRLPQREKASTEAPPYYKIWVRSRANNDHLKASVFDKPQTKRMYVLEKLAHPDVDKNLGEFLATHNKEVLGGAFNMLDQLLKANNFLRRKLSSCNTQVDNCKNFTVAPSMVSIYWRKGQTDSNGSAFYLSRSHRIFISGGVDGDVNYSNTDHFDNSIILHEYGHFLADIYFDDRSPGAPHTGSGVIDPRLALSEGFATFFQAAVLGESKYIDTSGNTDGIQSVSINFDLGENCLENCDRPNFEAEGNYRETNISRFFLKLFKSEDAEREENIFAEIWASMASDKGDPSEYYFKGMGRVLSFQKKLKRNNSRENIKDWQSIISDFKMSDKNWAQKIEISSESCPSANSERPIPFFYFTREINNDVKAAAENFINARSDLNLLKYTRSYSDNFYLSEEHRFFHYTHPGGLLILDMISWIDDIGEIIDDSTPQLLQLRTFKQLPRQEIFLHRKTASVIHIPQTIFRRRESGRDEYTFRFKTPAEELKPINSLDICQEGRVFCGSLDSGNNCNNDGQSPLCNISIQFQTNRRGVIFKSSIKRSLPQGEYLLEISNPDVYKPPLVYNHNFKYILRIQGDRLCPIN